MDKEQRVRKAIMISPRVWRAAELAAGYNQMSASRYIEYMLCASMVNNSVRPVVEHFHNFMALTYGDVDDVIINPPAKTDPRIAKAEVYRGEPQGPLPAPPPAPPVDTHWPKSLLVNGNAAQQYEDGRVMCSLLSEGQWYDIEISPLPEDWPAAVEAKDDDGNWWVTINNKTKPPIFAALPLDRVKSPR